MEVRILSRWTYLAAFCLVPLDTKYHTDGRKYTWQVKQSFKNVDCVPFPPAPNHNTFISWKKKMMLRKDFVCIQTNRYFVCLNVGNTEKALHILIGFEFFETPPHLYFGNAVCALQSIIHDSWYRTGDNFVFDSSEI